MRFRRAERDSPEINLTPLIDVVFLLLIFFMVSTTFEWRTELGIELPEASARASGREEQAIAVIIDAAGEVHVQGRLLGDPRYGQPRPCPVVGGAGSGLAAGNRQRRRADTASVRRHGHGRGPVAPASTG